MQKMVARSGSVTRTRLSSAALRPVTAQSRSKLYSGSAAGNTKRMFPGRPHSNIYKSFHNMGPEQIFRRFMDHSDKIHHDLLQVEYREAQRQQRGSSEGQLKSKALQGQAENQSKESPGEDEISDRDSSPEANDTKALGHELRDGSI